MICQYETRDLLIWPRLHCKTGATWHHGKDGLQTRENSTYGAPQKSQQTSVSMPPVGDQMINQPSTLRESKTPWTSSQSVRTTMTMNKYGLMAQEHWQAYAPNRYATIENPDEFFQALGEQVANEIAAIVDHLERQLPNDLEFMDHLGQMNAIQNQAEEKVLSELVFSVETEISIIEELEDLLGELPTSEMLQDTLNQIEQNALDRMGEEDQGSAPLYDQDEIAMQQWAKQIMPILDQAHSRIYTTMTEEEARDLLLALQSLPRPNAAM